MKPALAALLLLYSGLVGQIARAEQTPTEPAPLSSWQQVVRASPYWDSRGVFDNLVTVRQWVLNGQAFCADRNRHILFDHRATFLGYVSNHEDPQSTQRMLNDRRRILAAEGRVQNWAEGQLGRAGYPFALACHQPDAELAQSLARYLGRAPDSLLWGTWDGMRIGSPERQVSLHQAIVQVYHQRREQGRMAAPETVLSTLAGKVLIESGGQKGAHSRAGARGIMQLSPIALKDCQLPERFQLHRMAQIDCALRLLEQNHRNLEPVFQATFGHLPKAKAQHLYAMLLVQAYHGGAARVASLMTHPEYQGAARYFAQHHTRFSAGDIALGLIFHNLGRNALGFASLYYVVDVGIAERAVCAAEPKMPGCSGVME